MSSRTFAITDARVSFCFACTHFFFFASFRSPPFWRWCSTAKQCLRPRSSVMQTRLHLLFRRRAQRRALVRADLHRALLKYYVKMTLDECRGLIGGSALVSDITRSSASWLSDVTDPYRRRLTVHRITSIIPVRCCSSCSSCSTFSEHCKSLRYIWKRHIC